MSGMSSHHSAKAETETWLTPPLIIETLGPFDLDPCAAPHPRPWPTAAAHITWPDDGLAAPWFGRVWCNPPYTNAAVRRWLTKLALHGRGTALIFARTETENFFRCVWEQATAVLFLEGRLFFHYPDGSRAPNNSGAPSVLVAYGKEDTERLETSGIPGRFIRLRDDPGIFG